MNQDDIITLLSGAKKVIRESETLIKNKSTAVIEEKIFKGKYVLREEFDTLKLLVLKLNQEIESLKAKKE